MQEKLARSFGLALLGCLIVVAGAFALGAGADEAAAPAEVAVASSQAVVSLESAAPAADVAVSSMKLYRDPETGELTSTPAPGQAEALNQQLTAELSKSLDRSTEGLTAVQLPDGKGVMVDLQGRFQSVATVHVGADGQHEQGCGTTVEGVARHIAAGSKTGDATPDTEQ